MGDDGGEQEPRERPWWVREDRELSVAAHARSSREGQQEIGERPHLRCVWSGGPACGLSWAEAALLS